MTDHKIESLTRAVTNKVGQWFLVLFFNSYYLKVVDWITAKDAKEQDDLIKKAIKQGSIDEKRVKLEQESRRKKRRRTVEWNTAHIHLVHLPTFFIYSKTAKTKYKSQKTKFS